MKLMKKFILALLETEFEGWFWWRIQENLNILPKNGLFL